MNNLLKTYKTLESTLGPNSIESFEIVNTVHDYRLFWKPKKVKTVLLAESHVYTSNSDYGSYLNPSYLKLPASAGVLSSFSEVFPSVPIFSHSG